MREILEAALETYGVDVQLGQTIEELAELIVAIRHFARRRIGPERVAEEVADASIMLDQLARVVGPDLVATYRRAKLDRLAARLGIPESETAPRLVIVESPLAGDVDANVAYARRALLDSLARGEAPIASHLLYQQVLDDLIPGERQLGIDAGLAWRRVADAAVFYVDRGWSPGMLAARETYAREGKLFEERTIGKGAA